VVVGENGDAFLNPHIIEILRLIKLKLPQANVIIFTNFQHLTPDKIDIILKEKLINMFCCDIDSYNSENYFNIKKIDYNNVMSNFKYFLKVRKELNYYPKLMVYVLTLHRYLHTIKNRFNFYPDKIRHLSKSSIKELYKIPDDFELTKKQLKKILLSTDKIHSIRPNAWAEREQYLEKYGTNKINYKKYKCFMI